MRPLPASHLLTHSPSLAPSISVCLCNLPPAGWALRGGVGLYRLGVKDVGEEMVRKKSKHLHSQLHRQESYINGAYYQERRQDVVCKLQWRKAWENGRKTTAGVACVRVQTEYPISAPARRVQPQLLTCHPSPTAPHSPVNPKLLTPVLTSSLTGGNDIPDMCCSAEGRCRSSHGQIQALHVFNYFNCATDHCAVKHRSTRLKSFGFLLKKKKKKAWYHSFQANIITWTLKILFFPQVLILIKEVKLLEIHLKDTSVKLSAGSKCFHRVSSSFRPTETGFVWLSELDHDDQWERQLMVLPSKGVGLYRLTLACNCFWQKLKIPSSVLTE